MTMLLVTAAEMRALDRATLEGGHVPGETLMERAGAGVARALEERYGSLLALRVLILCGTGNNGGDGVVAARHLFARGAEPHVVLAGARARVRGDALAHLRRYEAAGGTTVAAADETALAAAIATSDRWDFALDALLGTGAQGPPEGVVAAAVQALRELDERGTRVVAVDLPTGVDADSGAIARRAVRADLTVTFGAPKRGHWLYPGRAFRGELEVVDIGLLPPARATDCPVEVAIAGGIAERLPVRDPRAHKGSVGRVLVVGGSVGLTGAAALAARAATRAGAGYVQCVVPASLNDILEVKLTEEMTLPVAESPRRALSASAWPAVREHLRRVDAVLLGSGLSRDPDAAWLARRIVEERALPMVLDADGLHAIAGRGMPAPRAGAPLVLTPHLGEMSRLTGVPAATLESGRIDLAREWAARWGAVVVLKGAPTVVAGPDGRASVNPTGNPGMATAGTGDVLAGMLAALLAQRVDPWDAARLAVYAHGDAGDRAAAVQGVHGMSAGDLLEEVPRALAALAELSSRRAAERAGG
jgi:NAD(P)H-hydrate epimerase